MCVISLIAVALLLFMPGASNSAPAAANSIRVDALVNSGNFAVGSPVAPGTIVSLFGSGFTSTTAVATATPLPTNLGGVSVTVNGISAPLFFVSPNQINLQMPFEVSGTQASVIVNTSAGASTPFSIPLTATSPAIFTVLNNGSGPGAITHAGGTLITRDNPMLPGETIVIYATGLGPVSPAVASGAVAPGPPNFAQLSAAPHVLIDGLDSLIYFAGLAPGQVGLYQINAQVPKNIRSPYPSIAIQTSGATSGAVTAGGPGILDVLPSPVPANANATVLIRGTNLPADGVLMLNGQRITAQLTGTSDQIQAVVPAAAIPTPGQYLLQISSKGDPSVVSNASNLSVNSAAPFSLSKMLVSFPQSQASCGGGIGYSDAIAVTGAANVKAASNASWLVASVSAGSITITASPDGLTPGQYVGTVAVTLSSGDPGEIDVRVVLSVNGPGTPAVALTSPSVYAIDSLQRVQLTDAVPANGAKFATVSAAGNEYQAFQIVINGGAAGYNNVSASLTTPFTNSACAAVPVQFYREHYISITTPSHNGDGGALPGVYPDALIPFVNPFTGAPLSGGRYPSAPFDVAPGQNQPVYVEAYVPAGTLPGSYTGLITVTRDNGIPLAQVPVTLTVWNLSLPEKPSFRSSFHAYDSDHSIGPAAYYGYAAGSPQHLSMAAAMDEAMIAHRVIPESPINTVFSANSQGHLVQDSASAKVDSLLARPEYSDFSPNLGLHSPFSDPLGKDQARTKTYVNDVYQWLTSRGYQDKAWYRTADEPVSASDFQTAANFADLIHLGNPNAAVGITTAFDTPYLNTYLVGHINIFMMHNTFFDPAWVATRQAAGDRVWSYTAVVQNTSNPTPYWQIEFPLLNYRIIPWISYRYGLEGLLYWTTDKWNEVLARGNSMWIDPCSLNDSGTCFNGDGNLFYPGKEVNFVIPANAYGSASPAAAYGPIPSLRLKALRDGMQDFELFTLAAKRNSSAAMQAVIQVACNGNPNPGDVNNNCFHNWNKDPNAIRAARAQLAAIAAQ